MEDYRYAIQEESSRAQICLNDNLGTPGVESILICWNDDWKQEYY